MVSRSLSGTYHLKDPDGRWCMTIELAVVSSEILEPLTHAIEYQLMSEIETDMRRLVSDTYGPL